MEPVDPVLLASPGLPVGPVEPVIPVEPVDPVLLASPGLPVGPV